MATERIPTIENLISFGEEQKPPELNGENARYWILAQFLNGDLEVPDGYKKPGTKKRRIGQSWLTKDNDAMPLADFSTYTKSQLGNTDNLLEGARLFMKRHNINGIKSLDTITKTDQFDNDTELHELLPDPSVVVESNIAKSSTIDHFWERARELLKRNEWDALRFVYHHDITIKDYAKFKGVSSRAIQNRIKSAKGKLANHKELLDLLRD